jgi:two-component system, cell cycle sensor histidine kinase and response regulator CckA
VARLRTRAWWIAGTYFVVATLWILFSDQAIAALAPDADELLRYGTLKGLAFVTVTAVLLFFLIQRAFRRTAEGYDAVRASEAEFRLLVETLPQIVWITGPDGRHLDFNQRWLDMTGLSLEESLGQGWANAFHPDDQDRARARWDQAITTGEPYEIEYRLRSADGTFHWMLGRALPLRDESGRILKWFGTCTDIDDIKDAEARLQRAQRLESIGTLAGGLAHDLNNLLTPILTGAALLRMDGATDDGDEVIDIIETSTRRASELVQQVLSFARGVNGERATLRLRTLVDEATSIVASTSPTSVTIDVTVAEDLWPVSGDATQLNRVLMNLLVNAVDAVDGDGRIDIHARNVTLHEPRPHLTGQADPGRHVAVAVHDDGVGMSPDLLDRAFDPFVTTKETGAGTGLGLSTALGIVTSHGGFIEVDSTEGQGSTFEVYLPAVDSIAPGPDGTDDQQPDHDSTRPLVLLVDDEAPIRATTRQMLESLGFRVITAENGDEAIDLFRQHRGQVDVVLTDLMMPGMDGNALIEELRQLQPSVRVIATSGVPVTIPGGGHDNGDAPHFLQKPYQGADLQAALYAVLDDAGS